MKLIKTLVVSIFTILFLFSSSVFAADIYLQSASLSVSEQDLATVNVSINTSGTVINNVDATIVFPTDLLSVQSISTSGSILNLWVEQPSFSNNAGTISFDGGVPNPGYSGQGGKVITIYFKAKKSGVATLSFQNGTIRANDGLGTDVTQNRNGISLTISSAASAPVAPVAPVVDNLPPAPIITSIQTPNSKDWYAIKNATYQWNIPTGVTAVQTLFGKNADSVPLVAYDPPIGNKGVTNIPDGKWFLHVRFKNANGWGPITHRSVNIDTEKPDQLQVLDSLDNENHVVLDISAHDKTSDISKFAIFVDSVLISEQKTTDDSGHIQYTLPALNPGTKAVVVRAYDEAQNYTEKNLTINAPSSLATTISNFPKQIDIGQSFTITGTTPYENSSVIIHIKDGDSEKTFTVTSQSDKSFSFTSGTIDHETVLTVSAEAKRGDGGSVMSENASIIVGKSTFARVGAFVIAALSILIPILGLMLLLGAMFYLGIYRTRKIKKLMEEGFIDTENEIHRVLRLLRDDVKVHIKELEKASGTRPLTKEEERILASLTRNIETSESYLTKKVRKISKRKTK